MKAIDQAEAIRAIFNIFKFLTDEDALAAIIVTDSSYPKLRKLFGERCERFDPGGLALDTQMDNGFVIDGLIVLRGTKL